MEKKSELALHYAQNVDDHPLEAAPRIIAVSWRWPAAVLRLCKTHHRLWYTLDKRPQYLHTVFLPCCVVSISGQAV